MSLTGQYRCALGACAAIAMVAGARADVFTYSYVAGVSGMPTQNTAGGKIESFTTSFNTITKALTFSATFDPVPGHTSQGLVTQGFWLVLDNGPDPKSHPGQLAIFYFDASNLAAPVLTEYGYNGQNADNSWLDGNPTKPGNQPGDLIAGAYNLSNDLSAPKVADTTNATGKHRTMSFSVNATSILKHVPLYPDPSTPWFGTGFGSTMGVWFHPVTSFDASYSHSTGAITSLSICNEGWIDASNLCTTKTIPAPGAMALVGLGGLMGMRRRRN